MMWFTADTHFGHSNIIQLADRPYNTIEEMDRCLVENINERVAEQDTLYVLGDFSFRATAVQAHALRCEIRCKHVHLIRGNHDRHWSRGEYPNTFESEQDYLEIKPGFAQGHRLILSHYPMLSWRGKWQASIMLHGHIHSEGSSYNERNRENGILRYDVGVDANNYCPVSRDDILAFFDGVEPQPARFE